MKLRYSLCLLCLISGSLKAQVDTKLLHLRNVYYKKGMQAAEKYYDSCLQQLVHQRKIGATTEQKFLSDYKATEQLFREQADSAARVAQSLSILHRQRPSRLLTSVLALLEKGQLKAAQSSLANQQDRLSDFEKRVLADLYLLEGDRQRSKQAMPQQWQDSLNKIATSRFETLTNEDTLNFVHRKRYIAQLFYEEGALESAIGTLLEAQLWLKNFARKDSDYWLLSARIANQLSIWQLTKTDINSSFYNAKEALDVYHKFSDEALLPLQATAYHQLATVYHKAGAIKEADSLYRECIKWYELLRPQFPERYSFALATVYSEYAQIKRFYDQFSVFDSVLLQSIPLWRTAAPTNPFAMLELAKTYNALGTKRMNVEVKIHAAMEAWSKAKGVLDTLQKRLPFVSIADEYSDALYRLGAGNFALKKYKIALPYFIKSLEMRSQLYQLAPEQNRKDYIDVLVQNGTVNAIEGKNNIATLQIDQAIKMAQEMGEADRVKELQKFKKDVLTH